MSVFVLVSGQLLAREERTSKNGKPYIFATIWSDDEFWNVLVFNEAVKGELLQLKLNDIVAVQGKLRIAPYTSKDGLEKIGRTIFVDHVLPLRPPRQQPGRRSPPTEMPLFDTDNFDAAWAGPR